MLNRPAASWARRRPRGVWNMGFAARAAAVITLSCTNAAAFQPPTHMQPPPTPKNQQGSAGRDPKGAIQMSTLVENNVEKDMDIFGGFMKMSPLVESDVRIDRSVLGMYGGHDTDEFTNSEFSEIPNRREKGSDNKEERIQFKGLSTTGYRGRYRRKQRADVSEGGRIMSSTMPGFSAETDRQRAYRDGIRLAELTSGRKFVDTPEKQSQRKRTHGGAMYRKSAAVPDSLVQFADDIHQEERITRKEEIQLGELTQEAVRLQNLYENLKNDLAREPTDDEWCSAAGKLNMYALEEAIEAGFAAKNRLVTSNLRMVQSVVNTYIRNGLSAQYNAGDMMQEGILALIRAAEKFEPSRGWKFSTYAMYWVRASVKRNQVAQSRSMPIPHRVYENHKRLMRIQTELEATLNRKPSKKELGDAVGMSELQVERCFSAMRQKFYSLDQEIYNTYKPQSRDRKDRLVEIVESRVVDDEYSLNSHYLREALVETLNRHLNHEEVELLMLRYGLKECPEHKKIGGQPTIAELSRFVGLKPDRVRRTIHGALKQLKAVDSEEWLVLEKELR